MTRIVPPATLAALLMPAAVAAAPLYFVEPTPDAVDLSRQLAFRAALGAPPAEEAFVTAGMVDAFVAGDVTVDVSLAGAGGVVAARAETFASGAFSTPGAVFENALLNRSSVDGVSRSNAQSIVFDFSKPVSGFGGWIFDDDGDSVFRMTVTEADGAVSQSPLLDAGRDFRIEGFIGAVSTVGITRVSIATLGLNGLPDGDFFELDHLQVGATVDATQSPTPVPLPASALLLVGGVAALLPLARRRG